MQHQLLRRVAKVNVMKFNITPELCIGQRAVMVQILPRRDSGMTVRFYVCAILFNDVRKRYISIVLLNRLIDQLENTLRTGKGH